MMRDAVSSVVVSVPVWPTVAPGWMGRVNAWITRYPQIAFRVGDRQLAVAWRARATARCPLSIHLRCAGHPLSLGLSGLEAIDARLVGEPFMGMPRNLRNLVVERLLTEAIAGLPPALAQGLELVAIDWHDEARPVATADGADDAPVLGFDCSNVSSGVLSSGWLRFDNPAALDWLLDRFAALPVRTFDGRTLGARVRLALGRSTVTSTELGQLEVGGFVWIDSAAIDSFGIRGHMCLNAPEGVASAQVFLKQRRVTVTDSLHLPLAAAAADGSRTDARTDARASIAGNPAAENAAMDDMEGAMKIDLSKLELQLDFELGDVMLPVGEIEKVGPGYVFELPQDVADSEVLIRVSGQIVAVGEIVAVGRRLGVRVTRMGASAQGGGASRQAVLPRAVGEQRDGGADPQVAER